MNKNIPFFIGLRYIRAKRRNHFISFISAVSMIGLTLGVMVLIIVMSVMNGFDQEMRTRVLGMVPHGTISKKQGIEDWQNLMQQVETYEGVEGVAPYIEMQGLISYQGYNRGILVYGIDPDLQPKVSILGDHMQEGELKDLKEGEFGIVLGDLVAKSIGAIPGDKITLMAPDVSVSLAGLTPRFRRFTVTGIFKVGAEMDHSLAIVHLSDAARLLRKANRVDGLRLKVEDLFKAREITWNVASDLGRYYVSDWTRTQGNLYKAIQMEKRMIGLLLTMIVAVAAFNIVSSLVMLVQDKQSDIAILRTMGASPLQITGIFMVQGSAIGVIGIFLGTLLGVVGALTISDIISGIEKLFGFQILDGSVYFISYFPSQLKWTDVSWITGTALVLSVLATLYPAIRASKVSPAEALRYE